MKKMISLGAYDRFNYGDLLFAHMIDRVATREVAHASIAGGDLVGVGGHSTAAIGEAMKQGKDEPNGIIVGGGDVLTASWFAVDWQLRSERLDIAYRVARRSVPMAFLNKIARAARGSDWDRPFLPPPHVCRRMPVVYHAVGGSNIGGLSTSDQARIAGDLSASRLVTVRDRTTAAALRNLGVTCEIAPDSVAAMAFETLNQHERESRHILIQASDNWLRQRIDAFSIALNELIRAGFQVSFLPIGLAAGHSDLSAYERLASKSPCVRLINVDNTGDIKDAIADASLFIGTSLHGHITAVAVGTPCIALKGVSKLEAYVATWSGEVTPTVEGGLALLDAVERVLATTTSRRDELRMQLAEQAATNTKRCIEALYEL